MTQPPEAYAGQPFAAAVLVAGGRSSRMGGGPPKPLLPLAGRSVLAHSVAAFVAAGTIGPIVVVIREELREAFASELAPFGAAVHALVPGGAERTDSARAGVLAVPAELGTTLVHDAARPLVRPEHIDAVALRARDAGAALLAVPVRDTLHRSADGSSADEVVDRAPLWAAQTPQGFATARLAELLGRAAEDGSAPTDEAALWEQHVGPVPLVEGSPTNLKLTTPDDLRIAAALLHP